MKRFVRSEGYARARLVSGALFMFLGAAMIVRSALTVGANWKLLPAFVLGAAMIVLGGLRYRDYLAMRTRR